jgi:transposase
MCGDAECEAKGHLVRTLVAVLEPLVRQLQHVSSAIEHAIAIHADGPTLMSFPRAGRINAAQSFRNSATIAGGSRRSNTSPLKRESLPSPRPRGSTER